MPDSRPPAHDMLQALQLFLENDILPDLQGAKQFHCRVAINSVKILMREQQTGSSLNADECARLLALLDLPEDCAEAGDLTALNRYLAQRIRDGDIDPFAPALINHIRQSLDAALAINNPRWMS